MARLISAMCHMTYTLAITPSMCFPHACNPVTRKRYRQGSARPDGASRLNKTESPDSVLDNPILFSNNGVRAD
jgi:hypothetical protein